MHVPALLKAPVFADPETTRVGRLLHAVICVLFASLGLTLVLRVVVTGAIPGGWWIFLGFMAIDVAFYALLRRGHVVLVGFSFVLFSLGAVLVAAFLDGRATSPALAGLYPLIMVAAFTGRSAVVLATTLLSVIAVGVFAYADAHHLLIARADPSPLTGLVFAHGLCLILSGLYIHFNLSSLLTAIGSARASERRAAGLAEEAQRAQKYADDIVRSMAEAVIVLDERGTIRTVNGAATALLGYAEDELLGATFDAVLVGDRRRSPLALTTDALSHTEQVYRAKDGRQIPVLFSNSILRDDGGKIVGVVCVASDITPRKELERTLREAKELAEEASAAKSRFLANMSHELRTPLNAVIGYSELLIESTEEEGPSERLDDLKRIQGAGKHLLGLISDILDLSKIEAGKMELHLETFDVNDMVAGVLDTVRPMIERRGLPLVTDVPAGLGFIHADQTKIRQILINLLGNAVKFTEHGEITLTVRQQTRDDLLWIRFIIRDTGIGMTESQVTRLFQPFSQPDASVARRFGGTGLGLALSRVFAEMMGGSIRVRSAPQKGSLFEVEIPYLDPTLVSNSGARPDQVMRALGNPAVRDHLPTKR